MLVAPRETLMITSGARATVRAICSTWLGDNRTRPIGPWRAKLATSKSGASRPTLMALFGMSDVPADQIRFDERTEMIAERLANLQHGLHLLPAGHRLAGVLPQ